MRSVICSRSIRTSVLVKRNGLNCMVAPEVLRKVIPFFTSQWGCCWEFRRSGQAKTNMRTWCQTPQLVLQGNLQPQEIQVALESIHLGYFTVSSYEKYFKSSYVLVVSTTYTEAYALYLNCYGRHGQFAFA